MVVKKDLEEWSLGKVVTPAIESHLRLGVLESSKV
jgi:hypothetical protein